MIPRNAIFALHDRLHAVITGQTPLQVNDDERKGLMLQCGPLCWILGHENNPAFKLNMLGLLLDLYRANAAITVPARLSPEECADLRTAGDRFVVVKQGERTGIQCLRCALTSWNPHDLANKYCAGCNVFHVDEMQREFAELKAQLGESESDE